MQKTNESKVGKAIFLIEFLHYCYRYLNNKYKYYNNKIAYQILRSRIFSK